MDGRSPTDAPSPAGQRRGELLVAATLLLLALLILTNLRDGGLVLTVPVLAGFAGALVGRWTLPCAILGLGAVLVVWILSSAPDPTGEDQRALGAMFLGLIALVTAFGCAIGTGIRKLISARTRPQAR